MFDGDEIGGFDLFQSLLLLYLFQRPSRSQIPHSAAAAILTIIFFLFLGSLNCLLAILLDDEELWNLINTLCREKEKEKNMDARERLLATNVTRGAAEQKE